MEPILNRKEIADLLQAIKAGKVSLDLEKEGTNFNKDCSPLDLLQANALRDEVSRIPNFDIILDNFAQNLGISFTNHLQRTFSVTRTGMDSAKFFDFLVENKDVGAIAVLDVSPLKQGALILIDSAMCFTMVEILLGASTEIEPVKLDRKLTSIELQIIQSIIEKGCDDLNRAFSQLLELDASVIKIESNSRLVSITDPDAEIIVGTFEIRTGSLQGEIKAVFPVTSIDPLKQGLKDLLNVTKSTKGLWTENLEQELSELEIDLIAQSGCIDISVKEILSMQRGDILFIDYDPNKPLNIIVGNQTKFHAIPGTHNGKKAINITSVKL